MPHPSPLQWICKRLGVDEGRAATLECHCGAMLRYLLLRFLPRRLVPLLTLFEIYRLFRRWQGRNEPPIAPPRLLNPGTKVDGAPNY